MKHIQIVLTLLFVVVVFSVGVFFIEGITTPIIDAANAKAANEAKAEVLPSLADYTEEVTSSLVDYDVADTGITDIFKVSGYGYVYQAEFQGFQSKITYMIGLNEDGEITGYKTLQQGDTPGLGAEIGNPDNFTQFIGKSLEDMANGNIDGLSGATITTDGWKSSLAAVIDFHNNEMLGFVITDVTADLTLPASVTKVEVVSDGTTDLYVEYTVEFETSYSSAPNVYTVSIDSTDGSIKKLVIVEGNDSDGIGLAIIEAEFAEQFKNMVQQDAIDGNFDVQAGASFPITFGAFSTTFDEVVLTHRVEFEDYVEPIESEADKILRWKAEISETGASFTDVTSTYDLANTDIIKVEMADDGTDDVAVILTFEFDGFIDKIQGMVGINLTTDKLIGFRVLSQHETSGLGAKIVEEEFLSQFNDSNILAAQYGVFDGLAGATFTTDYLVGSFDNVINFYRVEFLGEGEVVVPETETQKIQRLIGEIYPAAFGIENVSDDYTLSGGVEKVLEIKDVDNVLLGYLFIAEADGAGYTGNSSVRFMVGVNDAKEFTGFRLISDTETPGRADPYYLLAYQTQFVGLDIEVLDYAIDEIAGSTDTHGAIMLAAEKVAKFMVEQVKNQIWNRPSSQVVENATLSLAYPGTNTYVEVYDTMAYSEFITNIYEVSDGTGLIGHVIIGVAHGNSVATPINFAWSVNLAGTTQFIEIIESAETWQSAADCTPSEYCLPYNQSVGIFPTTSWLATQFESIVLAEILTTNGIDDVAGVSTTTEGMRVAAEAIAQYYTDNSIGGGS